MGDLTWIETIAVLAMCGMQAGLIVLAFAFAYAVFRK